MLSRKRIEMWKSAALVFLCSPKRPRGCKAELTYSWLVTYRDGIHARRRSPIRRGLTTFTRRTPLTTTPRRQPFAYFVLYAGDNLPAGLQQNVDDENYRQKVIN